MDKNAARILLVRAAPGSGKTWLVAEALRQELAQPKTGGGGIAALSFTRVGGEEIRRAVGRHLEHPHFVGTIDAFLFRFVLRPFLCGCFPRLAIPRLIPADRTLRSWGREHLVLPECRMKVDALRCVFLGEDPRSRKPILGSPRHGVGPLLRLGAQDSQLVFDEKLKSWKGPGRLTHSDAAYLARCVLRHKRFGPAVRAEVTRRFPWIVVDELQDTGYYLGDCIQSLLSEPAARGMLVGDPDQAIYEFNGAQPGLWGGYRRLPGAVEVVLRTTRRCSESVLAAASHLRVTSDQLKPVQGAAGAAFLLTYEVMVRDVERLYSHIKARGVEGVRVIARSNETVQQLRRRSAGAGSASLNSPALARMHEAVVNLRQGRNSASLDSAVAGVAFALFGTENLPDEELRPREADTETIRAVATRAVLEATQLESTGTLLDWQRRVGVVLLTHIQQAGLAGSDGRVEKRLKPQARKKGRYDAPASGFLPQANESPVLPAQTVHAVKGETHEATILVCRGPARGVSCPSTQWWPSEVAEQEERRIAYVAMTRTKGDLFVCVSARCLENLRTKRAGFVAAFRCMSIEEFIAADGIGKAALERDCR
ncbi:MAG: UvrD-helicase domain-containing protein [Vicinamibacteria bacterium]